MGSDVRHAGVLVTQYYEIIVGPVSNLLSMNNISCPHTVSLELT